MKTTIQIRTEYIRLQDLLKLAGLVGTGGEAKARVQAGEARVNGTSCLQRGKKLHNGDTVEFCGHELQVAYADR